MDICYYTNQIREEVNGACEYLKKAINCKSEHPEWASLYAKMAEAELDHATNLVKIFEDDYKKSDTADPIYPMVHESIMSMYSESVMNIKSLQALYSSK